MICRRPGRRTRLRIRAPHRPRSADSRRGRGSGRRRSAGGPRRRTRPRIGLRPRPFPGASRRGRALTADDLPQGRDAALVRRFNFGVGRFLPLPGAETALTADDLSEAGAPNSLRIRVPHRPLSADSRRGRGSGRRRSAGGPRRRTRPRIGLRPRPFPGASRRGRALTADDLPQGRDAALVRRFNFGVGRFLPLPGAETALTADDLSEAGAPNSLRIRVPHRPLSADSRRGRGSGRRRSAGGPRRRTRPRIGLRPRPFPGASRRGRALTADDPSEAGTPNSSADSVSPPATFLPLPGAEGAVVADDLPEGRGGELVRGSDFGLGRFPAIPGAEGR